MTPQDLANKLLAFYDNKPERWTQGAYARSQDGKETGLVRKEATSWCALGACTKLYRCNEVPAEDALASILGVRNLAHFNDSCADFDEFRTKLEKVANE